MGLFEELGLVEPDDMFPAPIEVARNLGLPVPADFILSIKEEMNDLARQVRQELEKGIKRRPPAPHELLAMSLKGREG
jgi:hypothetical protein